MSARAKRLFVTGVGGFVGGHLARDIARDPRHLQLVATPEFDVRDRPGLERVLADARPDLVVHLAAQSAVPQSFADPRATYEVNFFGTLNLLEALAAIGFEGRLLYVGSGDVYGRVDARDLPIREEQPLRPRNPYAVSKAAAEALCFQWSQSGPFEIVIARPFNGIGPGQSERFAIADFARRVVEISLGRRASTLEVGNLDVTRDFTDIRDVVGAYRALLDRAANGETYNICSGREYVLRDLVARLADIAGVEIDLVTDPARLRPGEQTRMLGSAEKIEQATGWAAATPMETTLRDVVEDWRARLK